MERLKDKILNGVSFEITGEEYNNNSLYLLFRLKNNNARKKDIELKMNYISLKHGLKMGYNSITNYYITSYTIPNNTFVDFKYFFQGITATNDGDRMEIEINEGKFASLKLVRERGEWFITEAIDRSNYNKNLKNKIEHFEAIEEQYGITLQNFSVKIEDEHQLKVFCEVLALNGDIQESYLHINIAIYDINNDIVYTYQKSIYKSSFKGFDVLAFENIKLDITVDEINKIRIYLAG